MASGTKLASASTPADETFVALLRGINVGAKNRVKMSDLIEVFSGAGCVDVRAYIQSGNLVFGASKKVAEALPRTAAAAIAERFGFRVPVVLRSAEQMRKTALGNPYLKAGAEPAGLFVGFLADTPDRRAVAGLDPQRSPGDRYEVRGGDIYMHLTTGAADTKLTNAYFDSALKTICTVRNWRTVLKLVEMVDEGRA